MLKELRPAIEATPRIQTYTGLTFFLESPVFDIVDIAHALGMLCRYNGHVRRFYSVAEHSVLVSILMEELKLGDPLEGLLHDASEAYLCDLPRPWKSMLPDYVSLETTLDAEIRSHFQLPSPKTTGCRTADELALFIEAWHLMPDRGASYEDQPMREKALRLCDAGWRVVNLLPEEATAAFLARWDKLGP